MSQKRSRGVCATREGIQRLQLAQVSEDGRLTYSVIAEKLDISDKTVARFFQGGKVERPIALKIVNLLKLNADDVLSLADSMVEEAIDRIENSDTANSERDQTIDLVATSSNTLLNYLRLHRYKRTNKSYTEHLGDGVKLTLMLIPADEFRMGAPEDEPESEKNERPQRLVKAPQFLMGRYPVTQAQWQVVAGYGRVTQDLNPEPSRFKGDDRPVERVSWEDAQEFCQRLSAKTENKRKYYLPSEAQWEYACRAGMATPFHFGEMIIPELANYYTKDSYNGSPTSEIRGETTEVGSFPANDWGLYDMHGNVWEWCEDALHSYVDAPNDGSPWMESVGEASPMKVRTETSKLLRGGSWYSFPRNCRSAVRWHNLRDYRDSYVGFRVCCVPPRLSA